MKRLLTNNPIAQRLKRSQRGQSVLLMAFAFIALLAFVGLVTDVAILFVRYAALRRAVDAAAIAAAGQIREGTDYGDVAIAAEQYIELHNIDPDSVLVETCETDIHKWRLGEEPWDEAHSEAAYPVVSQSMPNTELCDWGDPHKLVRVSAQIDSETTFLSLIGIDTITLEATSVSETAVLDIALVIDISESMSKQTSSANLTNVRLTYPYDGGSIRSVRYDCEYDPAGNSNERWAGCCNDPGTGNVGAGEMQDNGVYLPNGLIWHDTNGDSMYSPGEEGLLDSARRSSLTDPNSFNFTTLVCMPFKDVKDAARAFVKQLDFVRGDRVVFVTFAREGVPYDPDGEDTDFRPLIRSETVAIETLNLKIGVEINPTGDYNVCERQTLASIEWKEWLASGADPSSEPELHPTAYETIASCGNTNVGGGVLAANDALTDPVDVRREAVWVMIVLSDGAANVTNTIGGITDDKSYGYWGYCPWWTFCQLTGDPYDPENMSGSYHWPQCTNNNPSQTELDLPLCNDNDPDSRHFCLDWDTGLPEEGYLECLETGHYDADDFARDMADFAGLIELEENGPPGNFIAMFSIAFGQEVVSEPTGAPLLRYIADAGDNGFIDNNLQQDLREDRDPVPDYYPVHGNNYPPEYGDPGPCEDELNPKAQCGQYYYAEDLSTLSAVFEEIASRLFTRLSR